LEFHNSIMPSTKKIVGWKHLRQFGPFRVEEIFHTVLGCEGVERQEVYVSPGGGCVNLYRKKGVEVGDTIWISEHQYLQHVKSHLTPEEEEAVESRVIDIPLIDDRDEREIESDRRMRHAPVLSTRGDVL